MTVNGSDSRNDFNAITKEILAKRACYLCSNPSCSNITSGPHSDSSQAMNCGEAAHIRGARLGSKRFDAQMTPEERRHISNGIWLCPKCATLIDKDEERYPVELLCQWKSKHEAKLIKRLEGVNAEEAEKLHEQIKAAMEYAEKSESIAVNDELNSGPIKERTSDSLLSFLKTESEKSGNNSIAINRQRYLIAFLTGNLKEAQDAVDSILKTDPENIFASNAQGHILNFKGDGDEAFSMFSRALELAIKGQNQINEAIAYGNLALIYKSRGDWDKAVELEKKALSIYKRNGQKKGIASHYGNLGLIYEKKGNIEKAEVLIKKSLSMYEMICDEGGTADQQCNLGVIYQMLGDLGKAEEMQKKALCYFEKYGYQEAIGTSYSNLGIIYKTRGEYDNAEEMHKKALVINTKIGFQAGMANSYGNLGVTYLDRSHWHENNKMRLSDLNSAEEMFEKALAIDEKCGFKEGMACEYGHLGITYCMREENDKAEEMYKKAIVISLKLRDKEGAASSYCHLGSFFYLRGVLNKAERMYKKSLAIYESIGQKEGVANNYVQLGLVYLARSEKDIARTYTVKAQTLFMQMGMQKKVELIRSVLKGMDK